MSRDDPEPLRLDDLAQAEPTIDTDGMGEPDEPDEPDAEER